MRSGPTQWHLNEERDEQMSGRFLRIDSARSTEITKQSKAEQATPAAVESAPEVGAIKFGCARHGRAR